MESVVSSEQFMIPNPGWSESESRGGNRQERNLSTQHPEMEPRVGYATVMDVKKDAFDPESGGGGPDESWTPSAPVRAHAVISNDNNDIPYGERDECAEYHLPFWLRPFAFLGFLVVGAAGVALGLGALMLPMLFDSPYRSFFDNLFILGFITLYLGITSCLLILVMPILRCPAAHSIL